MIKIAFCDDEISVLNELRILLDRYRAERNQEIEYAVFHSPLELLAQIEKGARYDILFLDVLMPGENGINAAAEIRGYDSNVKIIFLTSSAEFAVQSYTVGAYFYQIKPIWEEGFFRLMDSAVAACEKERGDSLILRCNRYYPNRVEASGILRGEPSDPVHPSGQRKDFGKYRQYG